MSNINFGYVTVNLKRSVERPGKSDNIIKHLLYYCAVSWFF